MFAARHAMVVVLTAVAYIALFQVSSWLISPSAFSDGVSWVFLPSGLRLVFVLIFLHWGAIGVGLGSALISLRYQLSGDIVTAAVTGFISGFAPWLARALCVRRFGLDAGLRGLTPGALLGLSAVFALISASMHQAWYFIRGQTVELLHTTAVMALGDFLGTVCVLYLAKAGFLLVRISRA